MSKKTFNRGKSDYYEEEDDGYGRKSSKQVMEDRERKKMRNFRNNFNAKNVSSFIEDDDEDDYDPWRMDDEDRL